MRAGRTRTAARSISAAGPRRAEQKTLHLVAAFGAQPVELVHGLHAFGRRGDVEAAAEAGDRAHDRHAVGALRQILDERAVDLDLVERKAAEIAQAGIAGAEIVHRNADAELAQLMQDREIGLGLRQEQRFGDFKLEPQRRQSGMRQRRDHRLDQIAAAELHRRQIDGDLDVRGPFRRLGAGLAQHPFAERDDQSDILGDRNEVRRRDHALFGMPPAQQRFETADPVGGDIRPAAGNAVRIRHWRRRGADRAPCRGAFAPAGPSPVRRTDERRRRPTSRDTAPCRRCASIPRWSRRRRAKARCRCWRRSTTSMPSMS